jgi:hypothetical protein
MSNHAPDHLVVVHLPVQKDGRPAPGACPHLVQLDPHGRILRFVRMTHAGLLAADGGRAVLQAREERSRLRRFLAAPPCSGLNPWQGR